MRRILRRVLDGVIWLLTWPAVAHAAPVAFVAALLADVGITSTIVATVVTFVVNTAISAALSYAANTLFGPKTSTGAAADAQARQASVLTLDVGEQPRELVIGRSANAGTLGASPFTYGGQYDTDHTVRVVIVADHKCHGLVGFYVNDAFVAYAGDGPVDGYNNQLLVYWRDGSASQSFPSDQLAAWRASAIYGDTAPTTDTPFVSQAYLVFDYLADAPDAANPIWNGAHPTFLPVIDGKLCYDPRKDDTVGGSGAHRWDDATTWEWSDNLSVCRYNWVRGVYALDQVTQPDMLLIGRGLSTYEAPPQNVFAYANLCDETVDNGAGGTEPRYASNGVIRSTDTYQSVEDMFSLASAGQIIQPQGGIEVEPGQAKTPIFTITDDDLVVGAQLTFNDFASAADRVNTVIPRYNEPTQQYQNIAAPVQRDLDMVAIDGPLETTVSLLLVTSPGQAVRVGQITLQLKLLERTAAILVPPHDGGDQCFAEGEEGDWIQWTSKRHTNNEPVVFQIGSFAQDQSWQSAWVLSETSFAAFGFGGAPLPGIPAALTVAPPGALALASVTAAAISLTGTTGAAVPAIHFTWATPTDAGLTGIRAEVRQAGGTDISPTACSAPNLGVMDVTNGVGADMALQARLVPLGAPGRPFVPSDWIDVSTSALVATSATKIGDLTADDIAAAVAAAQSVIDDLNNAISDARTETEAFTTNVLNAANVLAAFKKLGFTPDGVPLGPFALEQQIRGDTTIETLSLIGVRSMDGSVFDLSDETLSIDGDLLADKLTLLAAETATASAAITTEATDRASADSAEAILRSGLASTVAANAASAATEFTTLSDAQSATATELHLLGAQNMAGTAFVLNTSTAQTSPGVSLASVLSGINSSLSTNSAAISTESSARVTGDSANASSISTLSSTVGGFSASISTQAAAISTLQGLTQASLSIVAAAGSDPAYLKLLATGFGSAIMLAAQSIGLFNVSGGVVLQVLEIVSGEAHIARVLLIDGGGKRLALGPAFGASSDLVLWFGADSIGTSSMTKANSAFAFGTDGTVYHGGSALVSGAVGLGLSTSGVIANNNGLGAGAFTTGNITVTPSGMASIASIVWSVSCSDGDGSATVNGQGTDTASFTKFQANNKDTEGSGGVFVTDIDGVSASALFGVTFANTP